MVWRFTLAGLEIERESWTTIDLVLARASEDREGVRMEQRLGDRGCAEGCMLLAHVKLIASMKMQSRET